MGRFDILGTYEAYKKFHVEEDGIPKTEDLLWTIVSTYTDWKVELTSSIDMELSVREANTKRGSGQKETLPAGTHFVLLKTDGEAYAEAMLDDGRICEFELEHPSEEEWEGRINGVSISDCFAHAVCLPSLHIRMDSIYHADGKRQHGFTPFAERIEPDDGL